MATLKLQTFMAHAGIASRRGAEELIAEGKVKVNGEVAHIGQRIDPNKDEVSFKGKKLGKPEKLRYFLVYKPIGFVSTTQDDMGRKIVNSLLPNIPERLYPVGRLDQDSSGLMLLTNDGDLAYKLTHPKFKVPKTYHVTVWGKPSYKALNLLREGVKLTEGFTKADRFEVIDEQEDSTTLEVTIHQGYNRQVRRMMERIGYEVKSLKRIQLGNLKIEQLDGKQFVELSASEVKAY